MRLEAEAVVNDVLFAVSNMFVSKTLPCAEDVAYINVETRERGRYCVELTDSGLRVNYFVYNSLTVFILNNVPVQKVPRKHLQRYQNSIHILLYFYESQFYVFPYRVALLLMQTKEEGKLVGKQAFIWDACKRTRAEAVNGQIYCKHVSLLRCLEKLVTVCVQIHSATFISFVQMCTSKTSFRGDSAGFYYY